MLLLSIILIAETFTFIIATLVLVEFVVCNQNKYCWKFNTLEGPGKLSKNYAVNWKNSIKTEHRT